MSGRHFGYEYSTVGRTRYYRADVGFNRRTNTNNHNLFVRYNSEPKPKARLISWRVYNALGTNFDWQGHSQYYNDESQIQFSFRRQTYLGIGLDKGYERVFEEEFGPKRKAGSNCEITNTCTFWGGDNERSAPQLGSVCLRRFGSEQEDQLQRFCVNQGYGSLDFDFGAGPRYPRVSIPAVAAAMPRRRVCATGRRPRRFAGRLWIRGRGPSFHMRMASVTYQPSNPLNLTLSLTKERLRRYDTRLLAFDENIVSLRSTYQFTRFIFARGRIDYDTLASNVKGQFLFGYTPNPGTAFYVGYNDDLNRNGFNPFSGQLEPGFRRNGRTFFIKMSYLFRKSFG